MMQFDVIFYDTQFPDKVILHRKFLDLKTALEFNKSIDCNQDPLIRRTFTTTEILNIRTVEQAYENGYEDAKNNKTKIQLNDGEQLDYYWAYCEGYNAGKS